MEVRGSILKGISDYIKINHSSNYAKWQNQLSNETRGLLANSSVSNWYSIHDALIEPSKVACELIFSDEKQGAWEMGRFAAQQGLTGIYKVFVLIATPTFVLKKAPRIMSTFYRPSELNVVESSNQSVKIRCSQLPANSSLLEYRIAGWIERAAEICNCKDVKVEILNALSKGDETFDLQISWS